MLSFFNKFEKRQSCALLELERSFNGLLVGNGREVDGRDNCNENDDQPESSIAPGIKTYFKCFTVSFSCFTFCLP